MYPWMLVWSMMGLAMPSINGIISKQVPANEQGEVQGALASVGGVTSVVAPVILTNVFAYFTRTGAPVYFPGAAFLAAGLMLAFAALLLDTCAPSLRRNNQARGRAGVIGNKLPAGPPPLAGAAHRISGQVFREG